MNAAETIGRCELCGEVDHHLVHGVCPFCRPRCVEYVPAPAPRAPAPAGAAAAVAPRSAGAAR